MPRTSGARPERVRQDLGTFAVLVVAAFVSTFVPLPWRLAGLVFAVVAGWFGLRLLWRLSALSRAGHGRRGHLAVAIGLGACMVILVELGGQAAFLPAQLDRQDCLAGAGTGTARQACEDEYVRRVR